MRLRSYLALLALAALIPVVVFAVYTSSLLIEAERAAFRRGAEDLSQALVAAVDAPIESAIDLLYALAVSAALDRNDVAEFRAEARRVMKSQGGWLNVHLALPSGRRVVSLAEPSGQSIADMESFATVLRRRMPAVGGITYRSVGEQWSVAVRVPVIRDGEVRYVLTANLPARLVQERLSAQELPAGWIVAAVDADMRIIARFGPGGTWTGHLASSAFRRAIGERQKGWVRVRSLDNRELYVSYRQSSVSGWFVTVGIPAAAFHESAMTALREMAIGVSIAVFIALLLAALVGRRIAKPLVSLAEAAKAMGRGDLVRIPERPPVTEVAALARALSTAAITIRAGEQQLRESEEHFRSLADNISQLAWMADSRGKLYWYNRRWFDYTGATLEQVAGAGWRAIVHPDHLARVLEHMCVCWEREEPWEDTFPIRSKTGEWRWFLSRALPLRDGTDKVTRWFGTSTDVTEQLNAQERLRKKEQALREALDARDEFLSIASHELTTPLASLKLQMRAFERLRERHDARGNRPGDLDVYVEQSKRQVQRLSRLVEDMLDISRIRTGRLHMHKERASLELVVRDAVERLRPSFEQHGASVTVKCEDPVEGLWDKSRLEQVLTNLLTNAMRYGGRTPIDVRLTKVGEVARLSVSDEGIGISPDARERIFDRFERSVSASEVSGLGLGLYIAKQIVNAHGGRIWAESAGVGRGATFVVELPIVRRETEGMVAHAG